MSETPETCPFCDSPKASPKDLVWSCGNHPDDRWRQDACYERELTAKDEQLKKFGDLENQLESYKAQWKLHYAQVSAIKLQRECMDVFDVSHKLAKHIGLDEYTPQTVADEVIGRLTAKDARVTELEQKLALIGERAVAEWDNKTVGEVDAVCEPFRYKDWLKEVLHDIPAKLAAERAHADRLADTLGDFVKWHGPTDRSERLLTAHEARRKGKE